MFGSSKKAILGANRLATRNLSFRQVNDGKKLCDISVSGKQQLHTTTLRPNYAATGVLPIPNNIDAAETTRFSPQRSRDINADVMLSQHTQISEWHSAIDITLDNSAATARTNAGAYNDPRVESYDCFGVVSLNSAMQSNVPQPFGGMHKFSHLNMPGGQWSQEGKFTSQNLHNSHYRELREKARSSWDAYNQDAIVDKRDATIFNHKQEGTSSSILAQVQCAGITTVQTTCKRTFCTKSEIKEGIKKEELASTATKVELSKKEQLKRAFKEYGATIIVFHVAISLVSLGGFYALVSGGIDMMPILEYLGLSSTTLSNKVAAGASTFVVAYAIHKVFAPVRISITLGATPFIVRYLRSKGYLKPKIVKQK